MDFLIQVGVVVFIIFIVIWGFSSPAVQGGDIDKTVPSEPRD